MKCCTGQQVIHRLGGGGGEGELPAFQKYGNRLDLAQIRQLKLMIKMQMCCSSTAKVLMLL